MERCVEGPRANGPSLEEVEFLHRSLEPDQREELLECLLLAAPNGGDSMIRALTPWLLAAAATTLQGGPDN